MAGISSVVKVNIDRKTKLPSRVGFGTPACLSPEANGKLTELVQVFDSETILEELLALGFTTASEVYKWATVMVSQSPKVEKLMVIQQATSEIQSDKVTVVTAVDETLYSVIVDGISYEFSSGVAATLTEIRDGLRGLIAADRADLNIVDDGTDKFDITSQVAGVGFSLTVGANLSQASTTANVGPVEAIIAARDVNDEWYMLFTTVHTNLQIELIASYIETQVKLFSYQTNDADSKDDSESVDTTGILKKMKDLGYDRTFGTWVPTDKLGEYKHAGVAGLALPKDPGSLTWKFKEPNAVTADKFTAAEEKNIEDKNGNKFVLIAGITMFEEGVVSSGEYIDIMRGTDWIQARIQERVFGLLTTEDKVPYSDGGIESIGTQVEYVLDQAVQRTILIGGEDGPVVSVPLRENTDPKDRSTRFLRDVTFTGFYAGAIHKVQIDGTLSI